MYISICYMMFTWYSNTCSFCFFQQSEVWSMGMCAGSLNWLAVSLAWHFPKVIEEIGFERTTTNHNGGATDALPSEVKLAQGYVVNLGKFFLSACVPPDQFNAIANLLRRLQHVSDCKVLDFMLSNPDVPVDTSKVFGSHRTKAIGNAISTWRALTLSSKLCMIKSMTGPSSLRNWLCLSPSSLLSQTQSWKTRCWGVAWPLPVILIVDTFLEVTQKALE